MNLIKILTIFAIVANFGVITKGQAYVTGVCDIYFQSLYINTVTMKKCNKCGAIKSLSCFSKTKSHNDGLRYYCKVCDSKAAKEYINSKNGIVARIYADQKKASKHRGHELPKYTKQELKEWLFNQELFHKLYDNWVNSGFDKMMKPSCDRLNDYKCYSFQNIHIVTWLENLKKSHTDMKNGVNNKRSKAILATHKTTNNIIEFYSAHEAMRQLNISVSGISLCCNGKQKSAGGYYWKFKNKIL